MRNPIQYYPEAIMARSFGEFAEVTVSILTALLSLMHLRDRPTSQSNKSDWDAIEDNVADYAVEELERRNQEVRAYYEHVVAPDNGAASNDHN